MSRLAELLADAARGVFPDADGGFEVLPAPAGASAAVVSFAAHHVIAADVPPGWRTRSLASSSIVLYRSMENIYEYMDIS